MYADKNKSLALIIDTFSSRKPAASGNTEIWAVAWRGCMDYHLVFRDLSCGQIAAGLNIMQYFWWKCENLWWSDAEFILLHCFLAHCCIQALTVLSAGTLISFQVRVCKSIFSYCVILKSGKKNAEHIIIINTVISRGVCFASHYYRHEEFLSRTWEFDTPGQVTCNANDV